MHQFEPSSAFDDNNVAAGDNRVGEHPSFDSEDEVMDSSCSDTESTKPSSCPEVMKQEFDQLAKRSYLVRRGRNNQLLVRPILQMIFDDGPNSYELSHGLPG